MSQRPETAWADIDLDALRHNARRVRALAPRSRMMAMLKADAYGHGLLSCARALDELAEGFAVARLSEAKALREAFPEKTLLLTAASLDAEAVQWCGQQRIAIVVHEQTVLDLILQAGTPPPVWLKLNTGMNRMGFTPEAFIQAYHALNAKGLEPVLMSHFSSADEPDSAPTLAQIRVFDDTIKGLPSGLPQSLANSAGILAYPDSHRDWVRPGIMLYGANPMLDRRPADLRPVMSLKARLLALNEVPPGGAVGYGRSWQAAAPARIGIVGIGYGDGYPRHVSAAARVVAKDRPCRLAGRVSMDVLAIECTAVHQPSVGDSVELWGAQVAVEDIAEAAGTIAYELLCQIQSRVPRRYFAI